jgi:hypothetical protein
MTDKQKEYPWISKKNVYSKALKYIADRRSGAITSLKCSLSKVNDAILDGFEFGLAVGFVARPACGKSVLKEQLIKEFFELNPNVKFRVLDYDMEMPLITTALREFSSATSKSYKALCSAEGEMLSREDYMNCYNYALKKIELKAGNADYPIDVIENGPTIKEFVEQCELYMETHAVMTKVKKKDEKGVEYEEDEKVYTNTVITIDHYRLFKRAYPTQQESDMLYELSGGIIYLKKKYPIAFVVFGHLGRGFVEASRCENSKVANYPVDSDVHGSDALSQALDVFVAMDRPAKRRIKFFGPERFIIHDDSPEEGSLMMFTFLKVRNGDTRSSFLKGEFDKMRIVETDTPACAKSTDKMEDKREHN